MAASLVTRLGERHTCPQDHFTEFLLCGLLAGLKAFEYGPGGDFRLAVADVSAKEPVHGAGLFHVPLDLLRAF